jgi:hypothetical protein
MKMLSGMQTKNNLYNSKQVLFAAYTSSQSSERHINSIDPVYLFIREIISWPFMIIAMNTIIFLRNLLPSVVITSALCVLFFMNSNVACCAMVAVLVIVTAYTANTILKIQTVSRLMPQRICRDFFISINVKKFSGKNHQTVCCETEHKKINSYL